MKTALLSSLNFSPAGPTAIPSTPPVREWLRTLHRVNPALSWTGWLNVALAVLALVLLPFDQRQVTGALVWLSTLNWPRQSTTSMPMLRAVPAMTLMPASGVVAFKSAFLRL